MLLCLPAAAAVAGVAAEAIRTFAGRTCTPCLIRTERTHAGPFAPTATTLCLVLAMVAFGNALNYAPMVVHPSGTPLLVNGSARVIQQQRRQPPLQRRRRRRPHQRQPPLPPQIVTRASGPEAQQVPDQPVTPPSRPIYPKTAIPSRAACSKTATAMCGPLAPRGPSARPPDLVRSNSATALTRLSRALPAVATRLPASTTMPRPRTAAPSS